MISIFPKKFLVRLVILAGVLSLVACGEREVELEKFDDLWDYAKPAETREKFERLLPQAKDDHAYQLELQTQIARTYSLEAKFNEAHEVLDQIELATVNLPRVRIRYELERGRTYNSAGDKQKAKELFVSAFQRAEQEGEDFFAVDAAHMVAIAEPGFDERVAWNARAIELAENSDDPRARSWIGSLANNLGWDHFDAGHHEQALDLFEKSQLYFAGAGRASNERIARWSIARVTRAMGALDDALTIQLALESEFNALNEHDPYVYEEIGEIYLAKGRSEEASAYFAKAYRQLSEDVWLQRNEPERLDRLKELSGQPKE
jgi:tetratricopeptide (TPR) repeat protein